MRYSELAAPPSLHGIIRCFWFLSGDDLGAEPQVIVPDGRPEIVLHVGEPFARCHDSYTEVQAPVLVSGQLTGPLRVRPSGTADVVAIRFRTAAAACVLSPPLDDLGDRIEDLTCVARPLAQELAAASGSAVTPEARAAGLARVLSRHVQRTPDPLACAAVRALNRADAPHIGDIAATLGVSWRTLERRVRRHTGLAPSALRRILRFRRAFRALERNVSGSAVAAQEGYFDQAHMIRDFREFAGAPPEAFFASDPDLARALLNEDPVGFIQ